MNNIIFQNELEFRNYILLNIIEFDKLFISLDVLDNIIYFYCLTNDNLFIAAKEHTNDYLYYKAIYENFAKVFNLNIENNDKSKVLKLIKK